MTTKPVRETSTHRAGPPTGRLVHPWAWWCWAIGTAIAVSATTNPLFLVLLAAAVVFVVLWRRTDAPWAANLKIYFLLALAVIGIRLFFQIVMGSGRHGTVILTLPRVHLPAWAAGIRLGGPVTAEALLFSLYDSLRLATMLLCVGAANALANPKRALRSVPAALYELSVAVTISLSIAPQLIESAVRVRRARRLRGDSARVIRGVVIPVMEDAVDRSLALAAGMEARGYGRTLGKSRRFGNILLLVGALVLTMGLFALFTTEPWIAGTTLLVALLLTVIGMRIGGAQLAVTHYRPDPWRAPEWALLLIALAVAIGGLQLGQLVPATTFLGDLAWPELHILMPVAAALVAAAAFVTPAPPHRALDIDRVPRTEPLEAA